MFSQSNHRFATAAAIMLASLFAGASACAEDQPDNGHPLSASPAGIDVAAPTQPAPLPASEQNSRANPTASSLENSAVPNSDAVSAIPKRFQYGFRLNLRSVYDDNIFLIKEAGGHKVDDIYFAIEPGITFGFGDVVGRSPNFIRFDYAPSLFLYLDHSEANALQHIMRLEGQYRFAHLSIGLSQDISLLEGANNGSLTGGLSQTPTVNLDAGGNVDENLYSTNATWSYDVTGKTFLSGTARYTINDYDRLISSRIASADLFANYTYSPKLTIGLGGTAGYNWVDPPNPDQSFEQINARVTYQVSGKVSVTASGGVEFRQFENDSRGSSYLSPVYELSATYQPFDSMSLTLNGSRRTQNSAVFAGQDYASTDVTFSVRQRFFQRMYLGATLGYQNSDYFSTVQSVDASRADNYFFVQPSIDVTLMRFWTVGAYYLYRQDDSSSSVFSFNDNQFGLRTSLVF